MSASTDPREALEMEPGHKATSTYAPLGWRIHHDILQCIERFAEGADTDHPTDHQGSFAHFAAIFAAMRFADILKTQRMCGRVPSIKETEKEYIELLLGLIVRHLLPNASSSFGRRLGALFLIHSIYRLHRAATKGEPPLVWIQEEDWAGVETLAHELRRRRHADGFRALHELWAGNAFKHLKVRHVFTTDYEAEHEAERQAARFGIKIALFRAVAAGTSKQIQQSLPALEELEDEYQRNRDAALISFGADPMPDCSLCEDLALTRETDLIKRARRHEEAEVAEEDNPDELAHQRRTQKRRGPYAPARPVLGLQSAAFARH
uniref:Uncharacterized protein n=1 Tax=Coccolithus braarudii TaxID=221442 RepID=A0A7S0LK26_9EUKA|mmetsp:Transcript_44720/g.95105  ORF Transcript_44720/g.95105 Transcript_44720/m.95105 type:complete len:321 (+) Transcript_44720:49-1011(+)